MKKSYENVVIEVIEIVAEDITTNGASVNTGLFDFEEGIEL
jgi:hypothetical protein